MANHVGDVEFGNLAINVEQNFGLGGAKDAGAYSLALISERAGENGAEKSAGPGDDPRRCGVHSSSFSRRAISVNR